MPFRFVLDLVKSRYECATDFDEEGKMLPIARQKRLTCMVGMMNWKMRNPRLRHILMENAFWQKINFCQ